MSTRNSITIILFSDLVGSTELMQSVGDESAQHLFAEHHRLLKEAVQATGGDELQWMGDGLMVAFSSTADAVRCAVAMQRAARQQLGEHRLQLRVGLNAGETLQQDAGSGHFGTPVVIAKRLCDLAEAGQILCTSTVAGLLTGRAAFAFRDLGATELKGIAAPVGVAEVLYEADEAGAILRQTPFVARDGEIARLSEALERVRSGRGELLMVVGDPGIGKTRLLEEFASLARLRGAQVLAGACYEGDRDPPFWPFAEAVSQYARRSELEELEKDLGPYAASVAKIVPALRELIPGLPEPASLAPDEEHDRLLDALSQFLFALSQRAPLVLILDDLHWADHGSIAMLRHQARFLARHPILLIGAYRDVELDRQHPLANALSALRRQDGHERILLKGMQAEEVGALLQALAQHEVPRELTDALHAETDGNPFFVREVILHLVEEGKLSRPEGRWRSDFDIEELGIPEGIRQVIGRRLSRLSDETNKFLSVASGFNGSFRFDVAASAAALDEATALDALDAALEAQLLRTAADVEEYEFSHALIRHTLYAELNPSRQVRLHRRIAEEMVRVYGDRAGEHAAKIAEQYQRSAVLPGAEKGVVHCLAAADQAESAAACEEAVVFLRMALELLPGEDRRRPRIFGRLGIALAQSLSLEQAVEVASDAGARIAASEGTDEAADYLADAAVAIWSTSLSPLSWRLAAEGMHYIGERRDLTWCKLRRLDLTRREAEDPNYAGMPPDSPERRELWEVNKPQLAAADWSSGEFGGPESTAFVESRNEIVERYSQILPLMAFQAGFYRDKLEEMRSAAEQALKEGRLAFGALAYLILARAQVAVGDFAASRDSFARSLSTAERVRPMPYLMFQMAGYPLDYRFATGEGLEALFNEVPTDQLDRPENIWARAIARMFTALVSAFGGKRQLALKLLVATLPAVETGGPWNLNYTLLICGVCRTLWELDCSDHIDLIERNLRQKILEPDFRYSLCDARLSMAWLSALRGDHDEATLWFAKARPVLEEEGGRPLRALVDYDEARMFMRRGAAGDAERARDLLDTALRQFRAIEMTGWITRAEALLQETVRH